MKKQPVVLVVMDGVGCTTKDNGNAVMHANKPTLDNLLKNHANTTINAHGLSVGLPTDGDMGNSEVGHNALGCGQVYSQGAKLVNESIETEAMFECDTWKEALSFSSNGTLHFLGLLSDGNVHSHINHLIAMLKRAKKDGVKKVRLHALLDGRDVPATSALIYVEQIEAVLNELSDESHDYRIGSGGGRMNITMDRYDANWSMVEKGWQTHVLGEARGFKNTTEAIETYRKELDLSDQDLPGFTIEENGSPIGTINDNDSVILFNFRGDRAIEISKAFEAKENFEMFDRKRVPNVFYCGMLQYDGDLHIPNNFLVAPPKIENTLSEFLVNNNVKSYAISETQKYGHVTYFWNGNRSEKFSKDLETWVEIPSDNLPFDQRPWMKAAEITDELIKAIESKEYEFLRVNYPNGDMVGHTGNYNATLIGVETVDLMLARIKRVCEKVGATLIITADHGNADEMQEKKKNPEDKAKPKTSHTLNPVPFIIYNNDVEIKDGTFGLSNVAATITKLLGLEPNKCWDESIIK
ncbi:MAG: 2,3-bisphosphoglycerate-independent phosphoglycerate mutase [Anaerorhabdus sp.]